VDLACFIKLFLPSFVRYHGGQKATDNLLYSTLKFLEMKHLIETVTQAKAGIPNILKFSWHAMQLCNSSRDDHENKQRKLDGRNDL